MSKDGVPNSVVKLAEGIAGDNTWFDSRVALLTFTEVKDTITKMDEMTLFTTERIAPVLSPVLSPEFKKAEDAIVLSTRICECLGAAIKIAMLSWCEGRGPAKMYDSLTARMVSMEKEDFARRIERETLARVAVHHHQHQHQQQQQ